MISSFWWAAIDDKKGVDMHPYETYFKQVRLVENVGFREARAAPPVLLWAVVMRYKCVDS